MLLQAIDARQIYACSLFAGVSNSGALKLDTAGSSAPKSRITQSSSSSGRRPKAARLIKTPKYDSLYFRRPFSAAPTVSLPVLLSSPEKPFARRHSRPAVDRQPRAIISSEPLDPELFRSHGPIGPTSHHQQQSGLC